MVDISAGWDERVGVRAKIRSRWINGYFWFLIFFCC
jgi:hypothetical protein